MKTTDEIMKMSDDEFKRFAWGILTNRPGCGGAGKAAMKVARRRFRQLGGKMYLALCEREDDMDPNEPPYRWSERGMLWNGKGFAQSAPDPSIVIIMVEGVTLDNCAHKMGDGDARKGWRIYHNH